MVNKKVLRVIFLCIFPGLNKKNKQDQMIKQPKIGGTIYEKPKKFFPGIKNRPKVNAIKMI